MDLFKSHQSITSTNRGYQEGCKYYWYDRNISIDTLYNRVNTLLIPPGLASRPFQMGFFYGYRDTRFKETGDMSPEIEEDKIMSKFSEVASKATKERENVPFVKVKQLLEEDAIFCIRAIKKHEFKKYGWQWIITVQVSEDVANTMQTTEDRRVAFTFKVNPDVDSRREILLNGLKDCTPHHSIHITETILKDGNRFHYLEEVPGETCGCGEVLEEDEEETDGGYNPVENSDEFDPFLDSDELPSAYTPPATPAARQQRSTTTRQTGNKNTK